MLSTEQITSTALRRRLALSVLCLTMLASVPTSASAADSKPAGNNFGVSADQGTLIEQPDPKRRGKLLWRLWAKQWYAASPDKAVEARLGGVTAVLYDKGIPAATLKAPLATGNSANQVIVATGRVNFVSLTQKGTSFKADQVTWSAKTNKGVATGHVVFYGDRGMTIHTDRLYFDTSLKTVQGSQGYHGTLP